MALTWPTSSVLSEFSPDPPGSRSEAVRDLGDGNGLMIQLRDAIAAGDIAGPRILAATDPLTPQTGTAGFWAGKLTA